MDGPIGKVKCKGERLEPWGPQHLQLLENSEGGGRGTKGTKKGR